MIDISSKSFLSCATPLGAGAEPYGSEVGQPIAGSGQLSFSRQLTISSLLWAYGPPSLPSGSWTHR